MKYPQTFLAIGIIACVILAGCQEEQAEPTMDTKEVNRKIVDTYSDLAIQNAIISQHTLYPYHFVNNSSQLNSLGERDLTVLIQHFKDNPGRINVQQGGVDASLYNSRTQTVIEKMVAGGIPEGKVQIASGMPGGEGMSSTAVIEILEKDKTTEPAQGYEMDVAF